jgi:CHASE2 domain-containing sensor protein
MQQNIWQRFNQEIKIWRLGALPGLVVLMLVVAARLSGYLQFIEWIAFDYFLRLRPSETQDQRIVIVGINDQDIEQVNTYPIPDREIAQLIQTLQPYQPRAIGLDIIRDIPIEPGHQELVDVFQANQNLIGIEKILPLDQPSGTIAPPPTLPPEQVGFSDVIPDLDGNYRRSLLGTPTDQDYRFSLALRLAETYLEVEGITLENGIDDPQTMRFASTELPRFTSDFGGYVGTDAGGLQVLLNFRSGESPFRVLSLSDIQSGNFEPSWLRDSIILIGITAQSAPDFVNTDVISGDNPYGLAYGVQYQAHATSQIISAVKDGRPLLKSWSSQWEYIWIIGWGIVAIGLGRLTQSALKNLVAIAIASVCLVGVSYGLLLWGWWIPVAPVVLILGLNGVGLSAFGFYQYDRALKAQIAERKQAMETAFTEIHNGPLQTLAILSKNVQDRDLSKEELSSAIQSLNREIREVGEYLTKNTEDQFDDSIIIYGKKIDLTRPIHELFYEIYTITLQRKFPYFETVKVKVRDFEPIEPYYLNNDQKRELCRFLEEALCNIGKHAEGVTRIIATGKQKDGWYVLTIKDNGIGCASIAESKGTKQSKQLAKTLNGYFKRETLLPQGTLCELTWKLDDNKKILKKLIQKIDFLKNNRNRMEINYHE